MLAPENDPLSARTIREHPAYKQEALILVCLRPLRRKTEHLLPVSKGFSRIDREGVGSVKKGGLHCIIIVNSKWHLMRPGVFDRLFRIDCRIFGTAMRETEERVGEWAVVSWNDIRAMAVSVGSLNQLSSIALIFQS